MFLFARDSDGRANVYVSLMVFGLTLLDVTISSSYGSRSNADLLMFSGFVDNEHSGDYLKMQLHFNKNDQLFTRRHRLASLLELNLSEELRLYQSPLKRTENDRLWMFVGISVMNQEDLDSAISSSNPSCPNTLKYEAKILAWIRLKCMVLLR